MTDTATEKQGLKFAGIQPDQVDETWPLVQDLVDKGLALENGLYRAIDIYDHVVSRKMQLWVAIDPEENKIVAVMVTQISVYPKNKACWVVLVGGAGIDQWIEFINVLKLWAKANGCDRILSYSRDGWIKKAAPYGFKKLRTLIGCSLENENGI